MKIKNCVSLAAAALIWGISFVAQDEASNHIQPFTFNGIRFSVAAVFLLIAALISDAFRKKTGRAASVRTDKKALLIGGALCGLALCGAITLQQFGFSDPDMTSGKAGFLSACYILIVPVLGLFFRKKATVFVWIGIAVALVGLYFLCLSDGFALSWGDALELGCAFLLAVHILLCDHFAPKCDSLKLTGVQCAVCAVVSLPLMFATEQPAMADILDATLPILFCGIFSSGVAYTFQLIGQNGANPAVAPLVMSFESVFAAVAGAIFLQQTMTCFQIVGCCILFAAIVLAQLPPPGRKKKPPSDSSSDGESP